MIRRLRIKFVVINMSIVTVMLCIIFGMVLHFTQVNMEKESMEMLQTVALAPHKLGVPGKPGFGVRQPYFTLQLGSAGEVIAYGNGFYDLSDVEMMNSLVNLSAAQKSGIIPEYNLRFLRIVTPTSQRIIFADMSSEINTIHSLLKNCLLIGAASFLMFLFLSILLSRWATKPVAAAWEQQRQFIADASHELKTPLTVILSNAQMLSNNGEDPELRERLTGSLLTVSEQMRELVNRLLNSARVDAGIEKEKFSLVDLSDTVETALLPFDCVFFEQELELSSCVDDSIFVQGSKPHLVQLVDILLDNARKYSDTNGRTEVTLQKNGTRSCLLTVANEGAPMTQEQLKQIFKRFYRADQARERTGSYGLGLSIAESIVRAHRGKIWAESKDGMNTFYIQLPTRSPNA